MPAKSRGSLKARKTGTSFYASYPNASPPLVWKFDLEKNHSFTLVLQGEEGEWELGVASSKGEFYPVAHFLTRDDADEAFSCTQKALMAKQNDRLYDSLWNIWGRIATVIICVSLALNFVNMFMHRGTLLPPAVHGSAEAPALKEGVPVPADQVLKPPS